MKLFHLFAGASMAAAENCDVCHNDALMSKLSPAYQTTLQRMAAPLAAALIGVLFCLWIVSVHVIRPTEVHWLMKTDWHFQFLGWHSFRNEPWQWPPGLVTRFYRAPEGTSIGYT